MTSLCRHLSPTAQETVKWVTTADGYAFTQPTRLNSTVSSASAVCTGLTSLISADGSSRQVSLVAANTSTTESSSACSMSRHNAVKTAARDLSRRNTDGRAVPNTSTGLLVRRCQQRTKLVNCSTASTVGTEQSPGQADNSNSLRETRDSWRTRLPSHGITSNSTTTYDDSYRCKYFVIYASAAARWRGCVYVLQRFLFFSRPPQ